MEGSGADARPSLVEPADLLALALALLDIAVVVLVVWSDEPDRVLAVGDDRPVVVAVAQHLRVARQRAVHESVGEADDGAALEGEADELAEKLFILVGVGGLDGVAA